MQHVAGQMASLDTPSIAIQKVVRRQSELVFRGIYLAPRYIWEMAGVKGSIPQRVECR